MTVLLYVDGESEVKTLPILARRSGLRTRVKAHFVPRGDKLGDDAVSKVAGYLTHVNAGKVSRVLLCVDSEQAPVKRTQSRINEVAAGVGRSFPRLRVLGIVVDSSLEGWLLWDKRALAGFLSISEKQLRYSNPEDHPRPADLMAACFSRADRGFDKVADLPGLAERVDLETLASRSSTFGAFQAALLLAAAQQT